MGETAEEKFASLLNDGEKIYYSEYQKDREFYNHNLQNSLIAFSLIISFLTILFQPILTIPFIAAIILLYLFPSSSNSLISQPSQEIILFDKYIITNYRILILDKHNQFSSILYEDIYNIVRKENNLEIIFTPFIHSNLLKIEDEYSRQEATRYLIENWKTAAPFNRINAQIQSFADRYDLNFSHFILKNNPILSLEGKINGSEFSFIMQRIGEFKMIEANLECSNEEKNFFTIYQETNIDTALKLAGKQDLKIGIPFFDKKFIIQSNNQIFIETILEEDICREINKNINHLQGKITMGIHQDAKLIKTFSDSNQNIALDAHLILENEGRTTRYENYSSSLIFTVTELKKYDKAEYFFEDIVLTLEMLVSLAQRINAYDEKNS